MTETKFRILVADDEQEILDVVTMYLETKNLEVFPVKDGISAIQIIKEKDIHLAVLDIMMPGMNGYDVLKRIRERSRIPVIFLSAKGEDCDKILGLSGGADDYLAKPFNPLELVARVEAQLRRNYDYLKEVESQRQLSNVLTSGELQLDLLAKELIVLQKRVELTSLEYKVIKMFMEHPGQIFTKKQIYESNWNEYYYGDDNTIMVHISKLRTKLGQEGKRIVAIKGLGYKLNKS